MEIPMVVRSFRIAQDVILKLEKVPGTDASEFIREAINEKLARGNNEQKEFNAIVNQIEKMDPLVMHSDLRDLLLTTQILFEEIKKQNEILKLIHRRSTLGANFSSVILTAMKGSESTDKQENIVTERVQSELKQLEF